jgi:transcriptional regulator with XRE-family HTH domain
MTREELASKIELLRIEAGLTQQDLGLKAGVSGRTIQYVEYGQRSCHVDTLQRLLDVLGYQLKIVKKDD